MTPTKVFIISAICLVVLVGFQKTGIGAELDPYQEVQGEMRVMNKILAETLKDRDYGSDDHDWMALLGRRSGRSPLYIPSVGAIFVVRVNMPIKPPPNQSVEGDEDAPREEEDLWQRFSEGAEQGPGFSPEKRQEHEFKEIRIDDEGMVVIDSKRIKARALQVAAHDLGRFNLLIAPAYDESRVEELRQTIIETVAAYGHRMEHLPDGENLMIVVEAPEAFAHKYGDGTEEVEIRLDFRRYSEQKNWHAPSESLRAITPYIFRHLRADQGADLDRWLFSFRKKDLTSDQTAAQLESELTEIRY